MDISPLDIEGAEEILRLYDTFDRPKDEALSYEVAVETLARIRAQEGEVFVMAASRARMQYMSAII